MNYRDRYARLRSDIPRWALRGPDGKPLTGPSGYLLIEVEKMGLGCYELHHDGQVFRPDGSTPAQYGTLAEAMEAGLEWHECGPEVVRARRAFEQAKAEAEQTRAVARAAQDRMRALGGALAEAEQRHSGLAVLAQLRDRGGEDPLDLAHTLAVATPGMKVWLLPRHGQDGYQGLGRAGVSLGMTGHDRDNLVVIKAEGNDEPWSWMRLYPYVVLTLEEARSAWWITDAAGERLVHGGWFAGLDQALTARDERYPGAAVRQGCAFVPGGEPVPA